MKQKLQLAGGIIVEEEFPAYYLMQDETNEYGNAIVFFIKDAALHSITITPPRKDYPIGSTQYYSQAINLYNHFFRNPDALLRCDKNTFNSFLDDLNYTIKSLIS